MPLPASINDLSTTAASNSPAGSEASTLTDDYLRYWASYIAQLRDVVLSGTANLTTANLAYTGTLTGSTGVVNIGSGQVYKDASGNVGLGTSSPGAKLHVVGSVQVLSGASGTFQTLNVGRTASEARIGAVASTNDFITGTVAGDAVFYNISGGNAWYGAAGAYSAIFATNNAERMRIDSSGNVGIGGSPTYALDLRTPGARLLISPSTASNSAVAMYANASGYAFSGVDNSVGTVSGTAYAATLWHQGAYPLVLGTNNAERMRIDSSGNVGIGTSSPAAKLHVAGEVRIDATTSTTATAGANGDVPAQVVGYITVNIAGINRKIPYYAA
jgi:hypothetical protein